jgi:hypothetical protein
MHHDDLPIVALKEHLIRCPGVSHWLQRKIVKRMLRVQLAVEFVEKTLSLLRCE